VWSLRIRRRANWSLPEHVGGRNQAIHVSNARGDNTAAGAADVDCHPREGAQARCPGSWVTALSLAQVGVAVTQHLGFTSTQRGLLRPTSLRWCTASWVRPGTQPVNFGGAQIVAGGDLSIEIDGQTVATVASCAVLSKQHEPRRHRQPPSEPRRSESGHFSPSASVPTMVSAESIAGPVHG
jgi:hypothetical protein